MAGTSSRSSGFLPTRFLGWGQLVLLAGVLVAVFLLSMIVGMRMAVRGQEVETPALVGMTLEDAQSLASARTLNLVVTGRRYDTSVPEGGVVSQFPDPGVGIKASRDVRVVVSLGRRVNAVPGLVGLTLRAARLAVEQQGYMIGVVSEVSGQGESGRILAQWPQAGSEDPLNDRIHLLVAAEDGATYVMPEFLGMNLNRAMLMLEDRDFETRVQYRQYAGAERGSVIRQFPEPGYPLREGETVNLEVAR